MSGSKQQQAGAAKPKQSFYWLPWLLYVLMLACSICRHELWGDELHSWNIAKASSSYADLLQHIRYEGHPPLWYTLMWLLSKVTHQLAYLQLLQFSIACSYMLLLLRYAPFSRLTRWLLPFGYYLLYEYGTLSRNYAPAVLLAFALCILLQRNRPVNKLLYYLLLFLLSNTHLLGVILAASLHLYYMLGLRERSRNTAASPWRVLPSVMAGGLLLLPALYFIFPPSDSEMNLQFWLSRWNSHQFADLVEAPLRSLIPVPAWWQYHSWNTEALLALKQQYPLLKWPVYLLSLSVITVLLLLLRRSPKALTLFGCNLLLTAMVATVFPLNTARYTGFIFIAFLLACWLQAGEGSLYGWRQKVWNLLLGIQLAAGMVACCIDIRYPFSNAAKVSTLLASVPDRVMIVSDYWCLNNLAAYADGPFYCIELNRECAYILWNRDMADAMKAATPYTNGLDSFFANNRQYKEVYMLSANSPEKLKQQDKMLGMHYQLQLVRAFTGAVERYSNVYLYRISLQ